MPQYRVAFGIPTHSNYPGLWATLCSLRRQICRHKLQKIVQIIVGDNNPKYAGAWIEKRVREKYQGKYVAITDVEGTGGPRDRLIKESDAEWTFVIDDHVVFPDDDKFLRMIEWTFDNKSQDLYHGPCLSDEYERDGQPVYVWTNWKAEFGRDGLFGKSEVSRQILAKKEPSRILHSGAGFFGTRTDSFLGFHPEQSGFGAEGWLAMKYREEGRSLWCHPEWPWQHCFRPDTVKAPYNTKWSTRAANYLRYVRDLRPNPYLTYSAVKTAHLRKDRVAGSKWAELLQQLNINEASMYLRERQVVIVPAGGTGTELKKLLLDIGITAPPGCDCNQLAREMDEWGSAGCELRFDEIVKRIKANMKKWGWASRLVPGVLAMMTGLAFHINWIDPAPDLVREAIRRAARNGF